MLTPPAVVFRVVIVTATTAGAKVPAYNRRVESAGSSEPAGTPRCSAVAVR